MRIDDCCRNPFQIVTILRYDHDRYVLYHQCLNCGGADKMNHLKSKDFHEHIRSTFNEDRFQQWKSERSEESNMVYQGLKYDNYKNTNAYRYYTYLMSPEWKAKRAQVLDRDNHICQRCKTEAASEVHHLSYKNVYNEPLEDLQALCRDCHFNLHKAEYLSLKDTTHEGLS